MKVYEVKFMEYTNAACDTVADGSLGSGTRYLTVGKEPFLVAEKDIEKLRNYGGGFRYLIYVGDLWEESTDTSK